MRGYSKKVKTVLNAAGVHVGQYGLQKGRLRLADPMLVRETSVGWDADWNEVEVTWELFDPALQVQRALQESPLLRKLYAERMDKHPEMDV